MELIGHRGVMAEVPQNTLPSFEAAIRQGVSAIELDTDLASTGEIIIFHDDDVVQITGGQAHGKITSFSFDELRKLNVNDGFNDGKFYQIPTLEEVLDLVAKLEQDLHRKVKVNIELKGTRTAEPVAKIVKMYLTKGYQSSDFIVSSFIHKELKKFKRLIPQIDIALLINDLQWLKMLRRPDKAVNLAVRMGAVAVNPGDGFVTRELVDQAHRAGMAVNVWTVKTQADYDRLAQMGVDGVFANTLNLKTS